MRMHLSPSFKCFCSAARTHLVPSPLLRSRLATTILVRRSCGSGGQCLCKNIMIHILVSQLNAMHSPTKTLQYKWGRTFKAAASHSRYTIRRTKLPQLRSKMRFRTPPIRSPHSFARGWPPGRSRIKKHPTSCSSQPCETKTNDNLKERHSEGETKKGQGVLTIVAPSTSLGTRRHWMVPSPMCMRMFLPSIFLKAVFRHSVSPRIS